ncbi:Hypothetical predicted protein [Paramuricea clavata]|uniref:Uncharacterized protein n=1 Tax=Paramuricea clavata TaxID=317549 RepID=A0A6S7JLW3_PARCT|nr:Hypothetical predicted protein [Paramuricea clavata]
MSSSSKLQKFLVKRKDTGKVSRIEIEEDKQIFDLLELSRVSLKFDEDAMLCMYRDGEEKILTEAAYIREIVDPKVILMVKDKRIEEKEKEKCKEKKEATDKENMVNATKLKESITEKLDKRDSVNNSHDVFRKQFAQHAPSSSPAEHNLLDNMKQQIRSEGTTKELPIDASEDEEIRILTRKINSEGLEGFVYEIVPESYTDHNESSYYERSFSSEEERRFTQSKVNSTTNWSSWQTEAGFSGWGVSVSASAGHNTSTSEQEGRKTQSTEKTCIAVVTKTSFHQMKKFKVNVKLSERAIKDAKDIMYAPMLKKQQTIAKFINNYCSFVYSGQFTAGGWFRTVATARSNEAVEFAALEKEATERVEKYWSAGCSGYGVTAGGGRNWGSSNQTSSQQSQQNTKSSVQVLIRKESAPGNTSNENDLEMKIKEVKNCTIFPVVSAKKSHFIPIYEIVKSQAEAIGDKELANVSHILRLYMKGEAVGSTFYSHNAPFIS